MKGHIFSHTLTYRCSQHIKSIFKISQCQCVKLGMVENAMFHNRHNMSQYVVCPINIHVQLSIVSKMLLYTQVCQQSGGTGFHFQNKTARYL